MDDKELVQKLKNRLLIEFKKHDRSGIYAITSRELAYNSNKIEGSTLSLDQTMSLFDTGYLPKSDDYYRAKDIEEMNGHFLMFNKMLETLEQPLSVELMKQFHYELKAGVFEDRANGYAVGEFKTRKNKIGDYETTEPLEVDEKMEALLSWYHGQEPSLSVLAEFHVRYEMIHPFQDGNGRTGRIILYRECLKHEIVPLVIHDKNRMEYLESLKIFREQNQISPLVTMLSQEQETYRQLIQDYVVEQMPTQKSLHNPKTSKKS